MMMTANGFLLYVILVHRAAIALDPVDSYFLGSACTKGIIPSASGEAASTLGALIPSKAIHGLCDLTGIRPKKDRPYLLQSNRTLLDFRNHFQEKDWLSVSIWVTTSDKSVLDDVLRPILTFAHRETRSLRAAGKKAECDNYNFRMAQVNEVLLISFTDQHGVCQTLPPIEMQPVLSHVAVAFDDNNVQVFVDGRPLYRNGKLNMTTNVRNWNIQAESSLQLFSTFGESGVFLGSISEVALFDQTLLVNEAANLFRLGAEPLNNTSMPPTQTKSMAPTSLPSPSPSLPPSWAPSATPLQFRKIDPSPAPSTTPNTDPVKGTQSSPSASTPSSPPFVYLRKLPTEPPSLSPTMDDPAAVPDNNEWQFLAFGVIGTMMSCFCLWSICGGWPRFIAHRSKSIEAN